MEDSPPPSNDAKLLDRLVPSFGPFQSEQDLTTHLERNHNVSADNEPVICQFYEEFGQLDQTSGIGVPALTQIDVGEKKDKTHVFEKVQHHLERLISYKQILKDREYQTLRLKIMQEENEAAIREANEADNQNEGPVPEKSDEPFKIENLKTDKDEFQ